MLLFHEILNLKMVCIGWTVDTNLPYLKIHMKTYGKPIPYICHFFYTGKIFGE